MVYGQGIGYRAVQALTGVALAAFVGGGYMALRAVVWHHEFDLARAAAGGGLAAAAVGAAVGVLYLAFGGGLRRLQPDWLSLQLGALLGALLYGGFHLAAPVSAPAAEPGWLFLQGAFDGLLIGAVFGFFVALVSGQPAHLSRAGLIRFAALFVAVVCVVGVALMLGSATNGLGTGAAVPLLLALRWGIAAYDRRQAPRDEPYNDYGSLYQDDADYSGDQ